MVFVFNTAFNFCVVNRHFLSDALLWMIFHCQKLNLGIHIAFLHQRGMMRRENFASQWLKLKYIMILRMFASNLSIASTAITDIHLSSADLEANLLSGGLSCLFSFSHAQYLLKKGSTVPVCLEEWAKKHQTWEECVLVEGILVRNGKRKKYLNRKHCKPQSGSDRDEQKLWSGILSPLFNKYSKTFY